MSEHVAEIRWSRQSSGFGYQDYNREHDWVFHDGVVVQASAAPAFLGKPEFVDPEEAFVAALSSCHMLTFLALASKKRFCVDSYTDRAVGYLEKNPQGKLVVSRVELRPQIEFSGEKIPDQAALDALHDRAHHECFIANSVTTEISVLS